MDRTCLRAFYSRMDHEFRVECDECGQRVPVVDVISIEDVKDAIAMGDYDQHGCVQNPHE